MTDSDVTPGLKSDLFSDESLNWVRRDIFADDSNEVRIISQQPVRNRYLRRIILAVVGLGILVVGAVPAISGELPGMARAALFVGGVFIALCSYPRVLSLVLWILSGGDGIGVRRTGKIPSISNGFRRLRSFYRVFK